MQYLLKQLNTYKYDYTYESQELIVNTIAPKLWNFFKSKYNLEAIQVSFYFMEQKVHTQGIQQALTLPIFTKSKDQLMLTSFKVYIYPHKIPTSFKRLNSEQYLQQYINLMAQTCFHEFQHIYQYVNGTCCIFDQPSTNLSYKEYSNLPYEREARAVAETLILRHHRYLNNLRESIPQDLLHYRLIADNIYLDAESYEKCV